MSKIEDLRSTQHSRAAIPGWALPMNRQAVIKETFNTLNLKAIGSAIAETFLFGHSRKVMRLS